MEKFPSYLKLGADSQTSDFAQYTAFKWTLSLHVSGKWFTAFVKRMYYGQIRTIFSQIFECVCMSRTGPNAELQDQKDPPLRQWGRSNMLRGDTTWRPQVLRSALGDWASSCFRGNRSKARHWMALDGNIDKIWQNSSKFFRAAWKHTATWLVLASSTWSCPKHTFDVHRFLRFPEISWRLKGIQAKNSIPSFPSVPGSWGFQLEPVVCAQVARTIRTMTRISSG